MTYVDAIVCLGENNRIKNGSIYRETGFLLE